MTEVVFESLGYGQPLHKTLWELAMATTIGLSVVLDHSQVSWTQPEIQTQPQGLRLKSLVTCHSNILIKR